MRVAGGRSLRPEGGIAIKYKLATGRQEDLYLAGQVPCPSPPITYEHLQLHSLDPPQMLLSPQPHTRLFAPFELSPVRLMTPTRPNFS